MQNEKRRSAAKILAATMAAGDSARRFGRSVGRPSPRGPKVTDNIEAGFAGLAPLGEGWVIAHDTKKSGDPLVANDGEPRLALLSASGVRTPLAWAENDTLSDIEALAAVPGAPGSFAVLASNGKGAVVNISGRTVTQEATFAVPKYAPAVVTENFESLALVPIKGATVAVWASRGSTVWAAGTAAPTTTPAYVHAATFNITDGKGEFGAVDSGAVTAPAPAIQPNAGSYEVRHVADLANVEGRLVGPAAIDRGNDTFGDSVLYDFGHVNLVKAGAKLQLKKRPTALATLAGHKVEAVGYGEETGLLGTDDENLGGFVTSYSFGDAEDSQG